MAPSLPSADEPPYQIVFFTESDEDDGPVWKWLQGLDDFEQRAALAALEQILAHRGHDICASEWGKALGEGLFELRIRRPAKQILATVGHDEDEGPDENQKILLRIFFHPYGQRKIVLLGGYDKLRRPSERQQQEQIEIARKRLKIWRKLHPG